MAILKIARMGHPVLRERAVEVADPKAPDIRRLIADMTETLTDARGAGLAAPQVHVPRRVVLFRVPAERTTDAEDDLPTDLEVLINPVITPIGDELTMGWEGCLSLPGMIGAVPRRARIGYRGLRPDGSVIERVASGFHARVVQHECDHLDGILYPMRMTDMSLFGFIDEMRQTTGEEPAIDAAAE